MEYNCHDLCFFRNSFIHNLLGGDPIEVIGIISYGFGDYDKTAEQLEALGENNLLESVQIHFATRCIK